MNCQRESHLRKTERLRLLEHAPARSIPFALVRQSLHNTDLLIFQGMTRATLLLALVLCVWAQHAGAIDVKVRPF